NLPLSRALRKLSRSRLSWSSSPAIAWRVTIRRGKQKRGSSRKARRAAAISVSLPAPEGPTTRTSAPSRMSADPPPLPPDAPHHRHILHHPHPHQVGAPAGRELAAIIEACRPCRIGAYRADRLRQADTL